MTKLLSYFWIYLAHELYFAYNMFPEKESKSIDKLTCISHYDKMITINKFHQTGSCMIKTYINWIKQELKSQLLNYHYKIEIRYCRKG